MIDIRQDYNDFPNEDRGIAKRELQYNEDDNYFQNETKEKIVYRYVKPQEIEKESFAIIEKELLNFLPKGHKFHPDIISAQVKAVLYRIIHTSADFDYANNLYLSRNVFAACQEILQKKPIIVTDTSMVAAGINKPSLNKLGGEVYCFINDQEVAEKAKQKGITRSTASMDKSLELLAKGRPMIYAIGNAPTALIRLSELIRTGVLKPDLIIAAPVGFVNVVESKQLIKELNISQIIAGERKGGSNIAAAICNALIYLNI